MSLIKVDFGLFRPFENQALLDVLRDQHKNRDELIFYNIFSAYISLTIRNAVIAVNAVKTNLSLPFTQSIQKITTKFTAFFAKIHSIDFCGKLKLETRWSWWMRYKINNSQRFLQIFTAKFNAFLTKFPRICFPTFTQSDLNSLEIPTLNVRIGAVE